MNCSVRKMVYFYTTEYMKHVGCHISTCLHFCHLHHIGNSVFWSALMESCICLCYIMSPVFIVLLSCTAKIFISLILFSNNFVFHFSCFSLFQVQFKFTNSRRYTSFNCYTVYIFTQLRSVCVRFILMRIQSYSS